MRYHVYVKYHNDIIERLDGDKVEVKWLSGYENYSLFIDSEPVTGVEFIKSLIIYDRKNILKKPLD